jgi:hypothetical protein
MKCLQLPPCLLLTLPLITLPPCCCCSMQPFEAPLLDAALKAWDGDVNVRGGQRWAQMWGGTTRVLLRSARLLRAWEAAPLLRRTGRKTTPTPAALRERRTWPAQCLAPLAASPPSLHPPRRASSACPLACRRSSAPSPAWPSPCLTAWATPTTCWAAAAAASPARGTTAAPPPSSRGSLSSNCQTWGGGSRTPGACTSRN